MENILGDLDGKTDVLRFVVGFLCFGDWQSLSSCSRSLANSDLRRFVLSQAVLRVPPPPLAKASNGSIDNLPTASYYADSFLRHMKSELLDCITAIKIPRTGMHLLNLLRALPALRSLEFWDYPYWTSADNEPEPDEYVINVAAVLQLLPKLEELNVSDADITLSELQNVPTGEIQSRGWYIQILELGETDVIHLAPLAMLPHLQSLSVRRTNVATLSVLEALPELHVLDVSETRTLDISKNWITTDLNVLQHLTALRSLKATNIAASNPLELKLNCPELEILHLQNTRLTNLEFATNLPNLTYLDIRWTHV
ncbi:unnamed protein product [Peronospora destructor]|uniref:Uncharacterized protein n=1 Tax=Peronospora destructor TaxID=86335 RepID=A0AAV0V5D5_9STRA|nr:unnamed protein product [Peronospora destructor]